ncbi:MAG TPA: response regulator [Candidatus Dormibacteraeota bacterium]|nr:response regulator [Candidatus Dormibacteraeota bacterium]
MSTILVVDDDESSRLVLKSVLEPSGHVVIEAADGQAALDLIRSLITPDIVVTDLSMPILAGEALISHLRTEPRTTCIPIVIVSGDIDEGLALRMAGHADAFISKPIDPAALDTCINALARHSLMAERAGQGVD